MTDVETTFLLNSLNKGVEGNEFKDAALNIPFANRLAILRAVHYLIPSPGMGEEKLALLATLGKLDAKGVNVSKLIFENGAALEGQGSKKYPEILAGLARSSVSSF